jgi:hypothetical protein
MAREPARAKPRALDEALQLLAARLPDPRAAQQHRGVSVEVGRREEREGRIGQDDFLLQLRFDPEHDHVGVALAGVRVERIRARVAEDCERYR